MTMCLHPTDPRNAIPLKQALHEVSAGSGIPVEQLRRRWQAMGIEFAEFNRTRTRVWVWSWSVPNAIRQATQWKNHTRHKPKNRKQIEA